MSGIKFVGEENTQITRAPKQELRDIDILNPMVNFGEKLEIAANIATQLKIVIESQHMYAEFKDKKGNVKTHVTVEGWSTLGTLLGCVPVVEEVREFKDKPKTFEATVSIKHGDSILARASAIAARQSFGDGKMQPEYAAYSMAQTRATGKAYRLCLSWIINMAGYDTTPEEEMEFIQQQDQVVDAEFHTPTREEKKLEEKMEKEYNNPHELFEAMRHEGKDLKSKGNHIIMWIRNANASDDVKQEAYELAIERNTMTTLDGAAKIDAWQIYCVIIDRLKLENKEITTDNILETLSDYYKNKIMSQDRCKELHQYIRDKEYARKICLKIAETLEKHNRPVHSGSIEGEIKKLKGLSKHQERVLQLFTYRLDGSHSGKCKEQLEDEFWIIPLDT